MSDLRFTIGDIHAAADVLIDVGEYSDTMTPAQCIEHRIACEVVLKAAQDAIALLNTQFVKVAEQDVVMDGRRFYVGRKKDRVRFDHDKIIRHVRTLAALDHQDDGYERLAGINVGAEAVAAMLKQIYLSDSSTAKVGALSALGLNTDRDNPESVRTWERGEKIVVAIPAGGET